MLRAPASGTEIGLTKLFRPRLTHAVHSPGGSGGLAPVRRWIGRGPQTAFSLESQTARWPPPGSRNGIPCRSQRDAGHPRACGCAESQQEQAFVAGIHRRVDRLRQDGGTPGEIGHDILGDRNDNKGNAGRYRGKYRVPLPRAFQFPAAGRLGSHDTALPGAGVTKAEALAIVNVIHQQRSTCFIFFLPRDYGARRPGGIRPAWLCRSNSRRHRRRGEPVKPRGRLPISGYRPDARGPS